MVLRQILENKHMNECDMEGGQGKGINSVFGDISTVNWECWVWITITLVTMPVAIKPWANLINCRIQAIKQQLLSVCLSILKFNIDLNHLAV